MIFCIDNNSIHESYKEFILNKNLLKKSLILPTITSTSICTKLDTSSSIFIPERSNKEPDV